MDFLRRIGSSVLATSAPSGNASNPSVSTPSNVGRPEKPLSSLTSTQVPQQPTMSRPVLALPSYSNRPLDSRTRSSRATLPFGGKQPMNILSGPNSSINHSPLSAQKNLGETPVESLGTLDENNWQTQYGSSWSSIHHISKIASASDDDDLFAGLVVTDPHRSLRQSLPHNSPLLNAEVGSMHSSENLLSKRLEMTAGKVVTEDDTFWMNGPSGERMHRDENRDPGSIFFLKDYVKHESVSAFNTECHQFPHMQWQNHNRTVASCAKSSELKKPLPVNIDGVVEWQKDLNFSEVVFPAGRSPNLAQFQFSASPPVQRYFHVREQDQRVQDPSPVITHDVTRKTIFPAQPKHVVITTDDAPRMQHDDSIQENHLDVDSSPPDSPEHELFRLKTEALELMEEQTFLMSIALPLQRHLAEKWKNYKTIRVDQQNAVDNEDFENAEKLLMQANMLNDEIKSAEKRLKELNQKLDTAHRRYLSVLCQEVTIKQSLLQNLLQKQVEVREQSTARSQSQQTLFLAQQEELDNRRQSVTASLSALTEERAMLRGLEENLQEKISQSAKPLEADLGDLKEKKLTLEDDITELRKKLEELEQKHQNVTTSIETKERDIAAIGDIFLEDRNTIRDMTISIAGSEDRLLADQKDLSTLETDIEGMCFDAKQRALERDAIDAELEDQLVSIKADIAALSQAKDIMEWWNQCEDSQRPYEKTTTEKNRLMEMLKHLQEEGRQLHAEHGVARDHYNSLVQRHQVLLGTPERLEFQKKAFVSQNQFKEAAKIASQVKQTLEESDACSAQIFLLKDRLRVLEETIVANAEDSKNTAAIIEKHCDDADRSFLHRSCSYLSALEAHCKAAMQLQSQSRLSEANSQYLVGMLNNEVAFKLAEIETVMQKHEWKQMLDESPHVEPQSSEFMVDPCPGAMDGCGFQDDKINISINGSADEDGDSDEGIGCVQGGEYKNDDETILTPSPAVDLDVPNIVFDEVEGEIATTVTH